MNLPFPLLTPPSSSSSHLLLLLINLPFPFMLSSSSSSSSLSLPLKNPPLLLSSSSSSSLSSSEFKTLQLLLSYYENIIQCILVCLSYEKYMTRLVGLLGLYCFKLKLFCIKFTIMQIT